MASLVDTSVKFAHSEMSGAPLLTGVTGSLIPLLDAFLVHGFGVKSVDSGVVAGGVCRLNFTGVSCADRNAVILVSGAVPAQLNGEQKVTAFSSSWVEFATDAPDGVLSGSMTFKLAPLGWEKVFSGTNKAVYRPVDPASSRCYLQVVDGQAIANVRLYEDMTDVDTGVGEAPPAATASAGYLLRKRDTNGKATGGRWLLVGDSRGVYLCLMPFQTIGSSGSMPYISTYIGDLISYRNGDSFAAAITGAASETTTVNAMGDVFRAGAANTYSIMRRASGLGTSVTAARTAYGATNSGVDGAFGPGPMAANNGLVFTPIVLSDGGGFAANGARGEFPGALCCLNTGLESSYSAEKGQIDGDGQYLGRALLHLRGGAAAGSGSNIGVGFFDITGPWRG